MILDKLKSSANIILRCIQSLLIHVNSIEYYPSRLAHELQPYLLTNIRVSFCLFVYIIFCYIYIPVSFNGVLASSFICLYLYHNVIKLCFTKYFTRFTENNPLYNHFYSHIVVQYPKSFGILSRIRMTNQCKRIHAQTFYKILYSTCIKILCMVL